MTTANVLQPATHALIIGVGGYDYLTGGRQWHGRPKLPRPLRKLQQLTSPPVSARAFADWLKKSYCNLDAPLDIDTMQLLTSSATEDRLAGETGATIGEIKSAFRRWKENCDSHPDNVAIFYFCGHGLQREHLILLAEDFCEDLDQPYANAINLDRTHIGMNSIKAQTQYSFIDSCRQIQTVELNDSLDWGISLTGWQGGPASRIAAPIYPAAIRGERAYSLENQPSLFTQALIDCLGGPGAQRVTSPTPHWIILPSSLAFALTTRLKRLARRSDIGEQQDFVAENVGGRGPLHYLGNDVMFPVVIECEPPGALRGGHFELRRSGNQANVICYGPAPEIDAIDFEFKAPQGEYEIEAVLRDGFHASGSVFVGPPDFLCSLKAER